MWLQLETVWEDGVPRSRLKTNQTSAIHFSRSYGQIPVKKPCKKGRVYFDLWFKGAPSGSTGLGPPCLGRRGSQQEEGLEVPARACFHLIGPGKEAERRSEGRGRVVVVVQG